MDKRETRRKGGRTEGNKEVERGEEKSQLEEKKGKM